LTQYVDTSILAAYYCPEPLSGRVEQRLRALPPFVVRLLGERERAVNPPAPVELSFLGGYEPVGSGTLSQRKFEFKARIFSRTPAVMVC
jgi:hypothetical protein